MKLLRRIYIILLLLVDDILVLTTQLVSVLARLEIVGDVLVEDLCECFKLVEVIHSLNYIHGVV